MPVLWRDGGGSIVTCSLQFDHNHDCDELCGFPPAESWSVKPGRFSHPSPESIDRGFGPSDFHDVPLSEAIADRTALPILIAHKRELEHRSLPTWLVQFAIELEYKQLADAFLKGTES